jgi:DNA-binding NtrC family response regulator
VAISLGALPNPESVKGAFKKGDQIALKDYIGQLEQIIISDALEANAGNISQTAKALGMQRTTLIERLKRLGLRT